MQLIYLANIFEDNYNIVRDRFETGSVNVIKYMSLVAKKQRKFQYISLAQPIRQAWELLLGTKILRSFVSHAGLWETLERNLMTWKSIWLMLLVICNDVIKSSKLYYALNRGQNESYQKALLNFAYFVTVLAILLEKFPFHRT